jgi:hypothetical protein
LSLRLALLGGSPDGAHFLDRVLREEIGTKND